MKVIKSALTTIEAPTGTGAEFSRRKGICGCGTTKYACEIKAQCENCAGYGCGGNFIC